MGTENKQKNNKKKKKQKQKKNTFLCKMRDHISRALLGAKFNCNKAETIPLSCLKLNTAKFIHIRLHHLWKYVVL